MKSLKTNPLKIYCMKYICTFLLTLFIIDGFMGAQDIILDRPVRAGELTLFQSLRNKNEYFYLLDKPRMARDERGRPQFSFLRYVENVGSAGDEADIDEGQGGGIVHAVIELGVTEEQLSMARQALRRVNSSGTIVGPAIYEGGTIALISSVSDPESGFSRKVIGLGKAPILDGQKAAVSILLTKLGAKVLWESFQTPTPDMSISFEMELEGYQSPKSVTIEANFEQIYTHQSFQAGMISRQGQTMLAGEIDQAYDDLYQSGAIKVTQIGEDEDLEKALEDAYSKLTRMMFEPARGNPGAVGQVSLPGQQPTSILDRAQKILDEGRADAREDFQMMREAIEFERSLFGDLSQEPSATTTPTRRDTSRVGHRPHPRPGEPPAAYLNPPAHHNIPPRDLSFERPVLPTTSIVAAYRMRESRQRGVFRIDLNKYTIDNLTIRFDENFGQIRCEDCFRQVNLDDPFFRQREITAILDGFNSSDFGSYINFVSVNFRKEHEGGDFTYDDVRIDRAKFNQDANNSKLLYGWKDDNDRSKWREYEYQLVWNFFGGYSRTTDWIESSDNAIPLTPPLYIKSVDVEVDPETMSTNGVRSVELRLFYTLGESEQMKQIRLNIRAGQTTERISFLQPINQLEYDYEVTWTMNDGSSRSSGRKSGTSLVIYADNL